MSKAQFFQQVRSYFPISPDSEQAWAELLMEKVYLKGELLITVGQVPKKIAFICRGLVYQSYFPPDGEMIIKYFFPENRLAASVGAAITGTPSLFAITAIETTTVLEYDFGAFRNLLDTHQDVAQFYIRYLEKHWIAEKEPLEIAFRSETAATRYQQFQESHKNILFRLKKFHIASYLGITPTQLSRITSGK